MIKWKGTLTNSEENQLDQEILYYKEELDKLKEESCNIIRKIDHEANYFNNILESPAFHANAYLNYTDLQEYSDKFLNNCLFIIVRLPSINYEIKIANPKDSLTFFESLKTKDDNELENMKLLQKCRYCLFVNGDTSKMKLYYLSNKPKEPKEEKNEEFEQINSLMMFSNIY